jgi:signal transduction histidine kinase
MAKIVVIEDDEHIRAAVTEILAAEGYETAGAADGVAGVELARSQRPDLVICDITMPRLDGYGVLRQLRQEAATTLVPLIFLTARATKEDQRAGMELGADDYLTKPFTEEELLRAVATRLARQQRLANALQARLDQLRQDIARALPHELRTPLHGLIAGADLLRAEYRTMPPEELREMVEIIYQSAGRLERLVENHLLYLELKQIVTAAREHGDNAARAAGNGAAAPLTAVLTAVTATVAQAAAREAAAADRAGDLRLDLQPARVPIAAAHLAKIAGELIGNAFKFSLPGRPVIVRSRDEGDRIVLCVTDQGRGMSAEQISAIGALVQFDRDRFEQQGNGLGLAIVNLLAEHYAGTLTVTSTPGQATTVCVTLPTGHA